MGLASKYTGKRREKIKESIYSSLILYANQLAWGNALAFREGFEIPPLCAIGLRLLRIFSEYGLQQTFSWEGLYYFEKKNGNTLTVFEAGLLKDFIRALKNGLSAYSVEGTAPPYMSAEFADAREKALEQVRQFNLDKK